MATTPERCQPLETEQSKIKKKSGGNNQLDL
jgi:hypothetical protein